MEKTFIYNDTTTIVYQVYGEGKTVILLHGFGEDSTIFDNQLAFLKDHCRLIVPDLPGSGKSDLLPDKEPYTSIEDYADCIHALLVLEEATHCLLLGHSMGGYITLAFARLYPSLLDGFGLIHSTAFADSDEKKQTRERGIEAIEQYGAYPFLKNTTPNLFAKKFKEAHGDKVEVLIEKGRAFSKEALQQYYRAMMYRPDSTDVLRGNPLPVLFVIGTEDAAAPMKDVLQQVYLPQTSYIHVLNDVGHMSMWEDTAALNQHLLEFIRR
jgi:pimeloyl-ACP methyl ester carboxylesterase